MMTTDSNTRTRLARHLFVAAWLLLIVSLAWDPVSSRLTTGEVGWSPWAPRDEVVNVRGEVVPLSGQYALGASLLWGIAVPLIPLGMMLFGERLWHRVCPLSAIMNLARRLTVRRRVGTGRPGNARRIDPGGWLSRNAWEVQFGLLFLFLNLRLLVINSDRGGLLLFFLFVIGVAGLLAMRFGRQAWCDHLCPMAPAQRIFSQPAPLLKERGGDGGHGYWADVLNPSRHFVYYGYFGLVIAYYLYYFLWSGDWYYYHSGLWDHAPNPLGELWAAGFYIAGREIPIPKLLAVPLTLAAGVVLGNLLWGGIRRLITRWSGDAELGAHRTLMLLVFCAFNGYYLFAGKPVLRGLPGPAEAVVTALMLALSGWWLARSLAMRPAREDAPALVLPR